MKKLWVFLLGVVAFAPLASIVAVPLLWTETAPANYEAARAQFDAFEHLVFGLIVLGYLAIGLFMILAFRSSAVPAAKRGLWAALLFFGNVLVLPLFWYWYVWRAQARV